MLSAAIHPPIPLGQRPTATKASWAVSFDLPHHDAVRQKHGHEKMIMHPDRVVDELIEGYALAIPS